MIETDEQRRWWFATHPEYSWSRKGGQSVTPEKVPYDSSKIDPKVVDAYVKRMLKYEDGPVADLLRSIKRHFGTGESAPEEKPRSEVSVANRADSDVGPNGSGLLAENKDRGSNGSPRRQGDESSSSHDQERPWLAGYPLDGGLIVPRLPTIEELFRLPKDMVRAFFRWLDQFFQNNPMLINPDALERHHQLVKELTEYFMECGLAVDDFIRILRAADHRLLPDGVHTGEGKGGRWNEEWRQFMKQYPARNTRAHRERIRKHLEDMEKRFGVDTKGYLLPPKPKRR